MKKTNTLDTAAPAKHTPKPWRAVPSTGGGGTARKDIVSDGAEFSPSFVAGDILPDDADLIAAAPELLAALVRLVALSRDENVSASDEGDAWQAARGAIAKAEGSAQQ